KGEQAAQGELALLGGAGGGGGEEGLVVFAAGGVGLLPLGVEEVVVGAPGDEGALGGVAAFVEEGEEAIEGFDALEVGDIAVAQGEEHGPGEAVGVELAGGLPVDGGDLEDG